MSNILNLPLRDEGFDIVDAADVDIVNVWGVNVGDKEQRCQMAAEIVRRVNMHNDLVAMIREMLPTTSGCAARNKAIALLSKVEAR